MKGLTSALQQVETLQAVYKKKVHRQFDSAERYYRFMTKQYAKLDAMDKGPVLEDMAVLVQFYLRQIELQWAEFTLNYSKGQNEYAF